MKTKLISRYRTGFAKTADSVTGSMLMDNERQMTFEEIDARAKVLIGKQRPIEEWPFIDEGDRTYWRKRAVEESKAASSNKSN